MNDPHRMSCEVQNSKGSTSTTLGSNRTLKESPGSTSTTLGSNRALKRSASTGTSKNSEVSELRCQNSDGIRILWH
jgi:hypothetical protein